MESSFTRFLKHFPRSDNITLIVLKGHLIVEEELNELIRITVRDPEPLFKGRFSFSQRLAILKAIRGPSGLERSDAIERLNQLRNRLAHHLEPADLEKHTLAFLKEIEAEGYEKEFSEEKITTRLKRAIALLAGELSGQNRGLTILGIKQGRSQQ